ncbi:MAG: sigma-70 family RNA polymerase sigma factor [Chloroflexales bacterium]|nr:sigma-70 family RNA polymerase sigma factor [Chloroflexales bacterium]
MPAKHTMVQYEDQQLVQLVLDGDTQAFNDLVERHQSRAYNLCVRMLGDADAAADVAQDAFISAYKHLPSLRGEFRPWLMRIVANGCRDVLRSKKRRPSVSLDLERDDDDTPAMQIADTSDGPEAALMKSELQKTIAGALAEIPDDQREVIILSDIQGLSYQEIADMTGINIGTVKSRLNRARSRLRELLMAAELLPRVRRHTVESNT